MQFRRSGQRDERRRRVLIDEGTGDSGQTATSHPSSSDHGGYTAAARVENQPRLTDLIPQRFRTWLLLGLLATAAIYGLQQGASQPWPGTENSVAESFDRLALEGPGTLAAWFSSLCLLVAAAGCGMVYLLRRHKVDDYRGHYRLWLWISAWCVLASLETATEIHQTLQAVVATLPLVVSADEFRWSWLIVVALGGLILGTRLTVEVRDSYWTNCFWLPTLAVYGAVMLLAFEVGWVQALLGESVTSGLLLIIGHATLAGTVWMEARHVFREAQGMIPANKRNASLRPEPAVTSSKPTAAEVDESSASGDPEGDEYQLACESGPGYNEEPGAETGGWEEEDGEEKPLPRKLTRAERKRVRRQRRKERRRQAA